MSSARSTEARTRLFRDPLHSVPVKYKLTLMMVVMSLMAFGVGGYLVKTTFQDALENALFRRLHEEAQASATALRNELSALSRRVEDFASDGYIRSHTAALSEDPSPDEEQRLQSSLRDHLVRNKLPLEPAIFDLAVLSSEGVTRLTAQGLSQPVSWVGVPLSGSVDYSPLIAFEGSARTARFAITTPLTTVGQGEPVGYLVAWVNPGALIIRALRDEHDTSPNDTIDLSLFDSQGQRLTFPGAWFAMNGPSLDSEVVRDGIGLRLDLRDPVPGTRSHGLVVAELYPIRDTGYSVEVSLDSTEAVATVAGLQSRFLAVGACLAALSFVLLLFPIRFLARPLEDLTRAARQLREGDLSVRVDVESEDEMGLLGAAFNEMAFAIAERTSRLEQSTIDLRAEQRAAVEERLRLSAVISSMRNGLVVLESSGEIVFSNDAARPLLHLLQHEKQGGLNSRHPCTQDHRQDECANCLLSPELEPRTCILEFEGGTFEVHATRLEGQASGQSGRLLVSHDITNRVAQDEREMHQERLAVLGEVAAVMAHELNNPLAAICIYAQLLDEELPDDSDLKNHVEVISRNTNNCSRTIRDLLTYATDATPETGLVDIRDIILDVSSFLRPMHERAGVSLDLHLGLEDVPMLVQGDELQVRQIFVNLIMNAVQAIDSGGHVVVQLNSRGDHHIIEVSDDGPGIAPSHRESIFRAFFTTKARGEGTGLGLSTARRIAELHGGGLELLETETPGSTFRVRLRRAVEETT